MTPTISTAEPLAPADRDLPRVGNASAAPWLPIALWVAFVAIALLANLGAIRGTGFLWTDAALVRDNALLNSLGGVQRIWAGLFDPSTFRLSQYSPLSQATFFIDRLIWGDRVGGFRLTSCLLHATSALMLWYLLRRLALPGAIAVALLFVAHPMTVESVSLLTERRTILATLLALAAAFLLLRAIGAIAPIPGKKSALPDDPMRLYAMAATLFVIGLFAHASIAAVPAVVLLLAWWRRRRIDAASAGVCVALLLAGGAMLAFDSKVERANSDVPAEQWPRDTTAGGDVAVRAQIAGRAVGFYALKLALPFPLMNDYPRWTTPNDVAFRARYLTPDDLKVKRKLTPDVSPRDPIDWVPPVVVVAGLVALLALSGRIGRGPFVGVASFVLCLLPVLGFVDLGWMWNGLVADRAAYLASVPFLAGLIALSAPYLLVDAQRSASLWTLVVVLIVYAALSASVSGRYRDKGQFWSAALKDRRGNPRSPLALMNVADNALTSTPPEFGVALQTLDNARVLRPSDPAVYLRIGAVLATAGKLDAATTTLRYVVDNFPRDVRGPLAAGDLYRFQADAKPTDPTLRLETLNYYREAVARDPRNPEANAWRGVTAFEIAARLPDKDKDIDPLLQEAAAAFDASVEADPYDGRRLVLIARTSIAMGKLQYAGNLLRTAITYNGRNPEAYEAVGDAALAAGDRKGAEAAIRRSIELGPDRFSSRLKLGSLLQSLGQFDEARLQLERAVALAPTNAEARRRLDDVNAGRTVSSSTRPATTTAATTRP